MKMIIIINNNKSVKTTCEGYGGYVMQNTSEKERQEQELRLKENLSRIKHTVLVMSGKGGVGKTSVAVNLAYALSLSGKKVGILDVDIHGPNVAKMLGIEQARLMVSEEGIEPVEIAEGLEAISISLMLESQDQPVIWRGPLKMATIKQFLSDVHWGELDYLVVDSPPGTGDEPLSVCQLIPGLSGAIIVTTPQDVALLDARRSIGFVKRLNVPVIGIIENMSGFVCPHCHKEIDIFKKGGGETVARENEIPFLGSIPIEPELVDLSDRGTPFVAFHQELESSKAFLQVVERVEKFLE
jgi:Mrp family chromosome partitioning ATPase